jgi:hypothetical protein
MMEETILRLTERKSSMNPTFLPSTAQLKELFVGEVEALGGTMSDAYDDDRHLFLRAILPQVREIRARDQVQGGVALRVAGRQIRIHPYLFRQVCRNGAIMAQAVETRLVKRLEETPLAAPAEYEVAEVLAEVRDVVRACCTEEVFTANAEQVRSAADLDADAMLNLLPHLFQMAASLGADILPQILERYFADAEDRSVFGLMNAVTSLARDTPDPERRWDLEAMGGGVPALVRPRRVPDGAAAVALRA